MRLNPEKKGIIVFHKDKGEHFVIGAGVDTRNGGDDYRWMNIWSVYSKSVLESGVEETESIKLNAKAIYVAKAESASAALYWTGTEYNWYQKGELG